jgi:hypothetical protein
MAVNRSLGPKAWARAAFIAALGLAAALPASTVWRLGVLRASVVQAGWRQNPRTQAWLAEVTLHFGNGDPKHAVHRPVRVEFIDPKGRPWVWKTFVSLAPGASQDRRITAPLGLRCPGPLAQCPGLMVRVSVKKRDRSAGVQSIPTLALPKGQDS